MAYHASDACGERGSVNMNICTKDTPTHLCEQKVKQMEKCIQGRIDAYRIYEKKENAKIPEMIKQAEGHAEQIIMAQNVLRSCGNCVMGKSWKPDGGYPKKIQQIITAKRRLYERAQKQLRSNATARAFTKAQVPPHATVANIAKHFWTKFKILKTETRGKTQWALKNINRKDQFVHNFLNPKAGMISAPWAPHPVLVKELDRGKNLPGLRKINSKLGNNIDQFWKELKGELTAQELLNKEKVIEKKSRIANLAAKTRKIILNAAGAAARIAGTTMRRAKHYARFFKKTRPSSSTRKLRR